jgi:hypothetical protein
MEPPMSNELFHTPPSLSPRLAWYKNNGVIVTCTNGQCYAMLERWIDELHYEEYKQVRADKTGSSLLIVEHGRNGFTRIGVGKTEEAAVDDLMIKNKLTHWLL